MNKEHSVNTKEQRNKTDKPLTHQGRKECESKNHPSQTWTPRHHHR